ncbi:MAG: hypothetical protein ACYCO9_18405 [Streptosporangiaceae bacterium]
MLAGSAGSGRGRREIGYQAGQRAGSRAGQHRVARAGQPPGLREQASRERPRLVAVGREGPAAQDRYLFQARRLGQQPGLSRPGWPCG